MGNLSDIYSQPVAERICGGTCPECVAARREASALAGQLANYQKENRALHAEFDEYRAAHREAVAKELTPGFDEVES